MMGRETIQILEMLTKEISAVFIHSTMVDRVASMLNYFLLHLVGPKKREFKVSTSFRCHDINNHRNDAKINLGIFNNDLQYPVKEYPKKNPKHLRKP